jgi:hypothetical protein
MEKLWAIKGSGWECENMERPMGDGIQSFSQRRALTKYKLSPRDPNVKLIRVAVVDEMASGAAAGTDNGVV